MSPPSKTTGATTSCKRTGHFNAEELILRDSPLAEAAAAHDASAVGWPSRCTWSMRQSKDADEQQNETTATREDPHEHVRESYALNRAVQIHASILECIGQTPLVQLHNLPKVHGFECQILAKCEFMNPGGSVKDRIALRMVDEAERAGQLVPNAGYTIIEPTSGNTGIGLALVAACRGYRCIIVMPEKMSAEKANVLRALGAEIVRTPTEAAYNAPDSHISKSIELMRSIPRSLILNQYRAPGNPLAHYDCTAEEILVACGGRVDMLVVGAGTGGTLCGLARKFHERAPECRIVGVDPVGSILAQPAELNERPLGKPFYEVEGIGYDFVPTVLDRTPVSEWVKTEDSDSLRTARELIRHEGLLAGGSSGAAMWATLEALRRHPQLADDPSKRVVVVLPDGVRNYMTKFMEDSWLEERDIMV